MSEPVLIAIITAVQGITIALIGIVAVRVGQVRRDAAATREQVVNDHKTNLREESDDRHAENQKKLDYIMHAVQWLIQVAVNNRERIGDLEEQTGQPQPTTRRSMRLARTQAFITENDLPHSKE